MQMKKPEESIWLLHNYCATDNYSSSHFDVSVFVRGVARERRWSGSIDSVVEQVGEDLHHDALQPPHQQGESDLEIR